MEESDMEPCQECGAQLRFHDGEYFCPSCDSLAGFELVPDTEEFRL